jgi:hypothetical protein
MKINKMNQPYIAPNVERRRIFLEEGIAANASAQVTGPGAGVTQDGWSDSYAPAPATNDVVVFL